MKNADNKRDILVQLIYAAELQSLFEKEVLENFWTHYPDITDDVKVAVEADFNLIHAESENNDKVIKEFINSSWSIERISTMERIILRSGISELFAKKDKKEHILRDYVALAKRYGDNKSAAFINGMLDNIARKFEL